jgi:site-specific recombinase XerD
MRKCELAFASMSSPAPYDLRDVDSVKEDWRTALRAKNLSPLTIKSYLATVAKFSKYLVEHDMPTQVDLHEPKHVNAFIGDVLDHTSPGNAGKEYRNLLQLYAWLLDENELEHSPMERLKPPAVPDKPVPVLVDSDLKALFAACSGRDFSSVRDNAICRLLLDTGARASELIGISLDDDDPDINWETDLVRLVGKGSRIRYVPFGTKTRQALRRYLRMRAVHPKAQLKALWLGQKGALTVSGLRQTLLARAKQAEVRGLHPHRFRHTFGHLFRAAGGQEGDLMQLGGWKTRSMVDRYGASAAADRARQAHRRLGIGDKY